MRWLGLLVNAVTAPLGPAGIIAAFATIDASEAFNVDTDGIPPLPHSVRNPSGAGGTTVAFNESALAVPGIPQTDDGAEKLRVSLPSIRGPPRSPAVSRVSRMRHGIAG